jgi:hypothetical protein
VIVLADNDILPKLAVCDLFTEFLGAFGVDHADIQILNTARSDIKKIPQAAGRRKLRKVDRLPFGGQRDHHHAKFRGHNRPGGTTKD